MKIILCVDDRGGILFNDRRLSRDSAVIGDIISLTEDSVLYTDEYSAELFEGLKADIRICDDPLSKAGEDDFCFIEKTPLSGYEDSVGGYIIYRWNRRYPADVRFDDG
ncbi:MAG: ribonuclease Z, partial [Clostridia bacterium]|nr:ribonuclease Z [Clostridia bacterium]